MRCRFLLFVVLTLLCSPRRFCWAAAQPETETMRWLRAVLGEAAPPTIAPVATLKLRRQDHGQLEFGRSVINTPLRIGQKNFTHGLGTHANSELVVTLPPNAKVFKAFVGVDNNADTQGKFGTVEFSVEIAGREVFRTITLLSGEEPVPVEVAIPPNTGSIVLKTDMTADGPAHDHADWADAQLVGLDGTVIWLDELKPMSADFLPSGQVPFSFVYGGKSSATFLTGWPRATDVKESADRFVHSVRWDDPQSGLRVTATATAFKDFPAVEWLLRFENRGAEDTPVLENVQALDVTLGTGPADRPVMLHQIAGSDASERDFVPSEREIKPGENVRFAPAGGRSSNGTFPFFNLQCGDGGVITAIGWTGQWAASLNRTAAGPTRLQAGMELTHLRLHPGEAIRSPRILLLRWNGDRLDAHNQFRRLLLAHYIPKLDGQPVWPCIGSQTFNRYAGGTRPEWNTEAGQIAAAKITRDLGCDTHWLDASWFEGGFPDGVGNWIVRPKEYPNGLKPVGDACQKLGLKFLVWYEPERVAPGTRITREHPEFVLGGAGGGLFNLGDAKARRWMTDLLLKQIDDFGIATYRNDFNMDSLPFWRQNDAPDRQGIAEIRYIEGLYEMWDEIRARHPGMYLDDCASGGRRIDLEMCLRSIVQTRSDSACAPGRAEWDQSQTYGLSFYFPAHATIGWDVAAYDCRSIATAGYLGEWDILDPQFPIDAARASIAEIKANQKFWYGDYYPLTPWTMAADKWIAYQFHRPDLDAGIVLAFRHKESPHPVLQVGLRGLKPAQTYRVSFSDDERKVTTKTMTGRELAAMELRLEKPRSSLLMRYEPVAR